MTTRYYHDGQNVIAEYTYAYDPTPPAGTREQIARTYVHGTQYIDERAVMRDYEEGAQDHYYLLKDLYTVAGLAGSNGALEEAYAYYTYGGATIYEWSIGDIDRDGDADSTDTSWVVGHTVFLPTQSGTDARCDTNLDGFVNVTDIGAVNNAPDGGVPITHSALGNPYFFTGRTTDTWHAGNPSDPDDITVAGDPDGFRRMQDNRNRMYDPKHGRWLQRDPLEYVESSNLYQYIRSQPTRTYDPSGLTADYVYMMACDKAREKAKEPPLRAATPSNQFIIYGARDAIVWYFVGNGRPATLSDRLIGYLKQQKEYQYLIHHTIPEMIEQMMPKQPCVCEHGAEVTGALNGVLTSPIVYTYGEGWEMG